MATPDAFEVRPLRSYEEFKQAEDVQRRVWKMEVDTELVPATILSVIARNAGAVLGAFAGEALVGICFSFLGRTPEGRIEHWSHINGVLDECQGLGLGEKLKWAQREAVLAMGVDLIRWTMDPLEGRPAALNFSKLGVTCCAYIRNAYGNMPDGLNAGIESDRFTVDWELNAERVRMRLAQGKPALSVRAWEEEGAQCANPTQVEARGIRSITALRLDLTSPRVLVEIPASFQAVKAHDLDLAVAWRMQTRQLFEAYFGRGYAAVEFVSELRDG